MEMDDNKRRRNMILYVLIAFVVYLVLSTVLFPNIGHTQQITKTDYSTFVKALDKKSVDKVEYNTDDYTIYYTKKGEDENIAYKTTGVPNDAGFTDRVLESGASLESVVPDKNSGLMTYYLLTLILPMAIFFLIGWWLNRRMKKAMGDDGPSMNFGGGGFGGGGNQGPNWGGEDSSSYGYLEVSGGLLYIEAEGDGFDSNGDGVITGGIVLVSGPTSGGNGVFDVGDNNNTLTITGGIVIGAGTSDMAVTPTKATNSQYYVVASGSSSSGGGFGRPGSSSSSSGFSTQAAGKAFKLTDSSGNGIVTYVPSKQYSWVLVSTPEMSSGTYTLNYGGSVTGGTFTNGNYGLVTDGTYSGSSTISLSAKQ